MKKRLAFFCCLCPLLALASGIFWQDQTKAQYTEASAEISEAKLDELMFKLVSSFEKEADEQETAGHVLRASSLRSLLERNVGFSSVKISTIKEMSRRFVKDAAPSAEKNRGKPFSAKDSDQYHKMLSNYREKLVSALNSRELETLRGFMRSKIAAGASHSKSGANGSFPENYSLIDYDPGSNQVTGYAFTQEPPVIRIPLGGCDEERPCTGSALTSVLESPSGEVLDSAWTQECGYDAEVFLFASDILESGDYTVNTDHMMDYYGCNFQDTEGNNTQDSMIIEIPNVTSVEYQVIDSPALDTNPNAEGGLRMFPDKATPTDTVNRRRIRVRAGLGQAISGRTIYFRNFDLDDPSADMTIDPNGTTGDDNNGDVGGSTAGQLNATSATTNSQGIATVEFTVTMQPGDNFTIAASTDQARLSGVSVNGTGLQTSNGTSIDIMCDGIDAVCRSEMLTVWRRLHIEVDSMGQVQQNFQNGNFAEEKKIKTTPTTILVNTSQPLEVNRYEGGRLVSEGQSFRIDGNTANSLTLRSASGSQPAEPGQIFAIYDDDDFNDNDGTIKDGDTGEEIPDIEPYMTLLTANSDDPATNILAPAYVRPLYDVVDPTDNRFYRANVGGLTQAALREMFFDRDLTTTNTDAGFWTVYVLGAYQYALSRDNDPSSEVLTFGAADGTPRTPSGDGSGVAIFLEAHNSNEITTYPGPTNLASINTTIGHEIGHLLSCQHGEDGIMTDANGLMTSDQFEPQSIRNIRTLMHP